MSYTVWLDGTLIGETNLELRHGERRRAGVFHPTELGLSVLPGITAMGPALLDTGRVCRQQGIDTSDDQVLSEDLAEEVFGTEPGKRVLEAAKVIARLELHGPAGELVEWESIMISDMDELAAAAGRTSSTAAAIARGAPDPVRYFISAKLDGDTFTQRLRRRTVQVS